MVLEEQIQQVEDDIKKRTSHRVYDDKGSTKTVTIRWTRLERLEKKLEDLKTLRDQIGIALDFWGVDSFLEATKQYRQWGISDSIIATESMKKYIIDTKGELWGYFAKKNKKLRNAEIDSSLESGLRKRGLTDEQIADFLCEKFDLEKCLLYIFYFKGPTNVRSQLEVDEWVREEALKETLDEIAKTILISKHI